MNWSRRRALGALASLAAAGIGSRAGKGRGEEGGDFRLATFAADITVPIGHPLMGGGIAPAKEIVDPLEARGLVLLGSGKPIVLVALDWCEVRNEAYDRWRSVLAEAAGTEPARVIVASVHQHDTPVADLEAQRFLDATDRPGRVCDIAFHEQAVQRTAGALRESLGQARRVTHFGTGQGKVEKVASNRRFHDREGKVVFSRTSATKDAWARSQPEGTIDPWLKTLSFWDGDRPVAALSVYAVHPMSYYGQGGVSADFVGLARRKRQEAEPSVFQIYLSGCSGNVTAGKYNDGDHENRPLLAGRIEQAMKEAWEATKREPLMKVGFRLTPLRLEPRDGPGFTVADLEHRLRNDPKTFGQCLAAMGLSWRKRADAGATIDVPSLDFGPAQLLLLPGESYVEYQLLAQKLRPDAFVVTVGYGECATGYVPTEKAVAEHDTNLTDWCWVAPGAEAAMTAAIRKALNVGSLE